MTKMRAVESFTAFCKSRTATTFLVARLVHTSTQPCEINKPEVTCSLWKRPARQVLDIFMLLVDQIDQRLTILSENPFSLNTHGKGKGVGQELEARS